MPIVTLAPRGVQSGAEDTTMTTSQIAVYNGRKYRLAWSGATKYGRRAKLSFLDGSKEFWVDLAKIEIHASSRPSSGFRRGPSCRVCRDRHDGGTICFACGQED